MTGVLLQHTCRSPSFYLNFISWGLCFLVWTQDSSFPSTFLSHLHSCLSHQSAELLFIGDPSSYISWDLHGWFEILFLQLFFSYLLLYKLAHRNCFFHSTSILQGLQRLQQLLQTRILVVFTCGFCQALL